MIRMYSMRRAMSHDELLNALDVLVVLALKWKKSCGTVTVSISRGKGIVVLIFWH
jgi:hypothetical protein